MKDSSNISHVPLFLHGFGIQGLISLSHIEPVKPFLHLQDFFPFLETIRRPLFLQ